MTSRSLEPCFSRFDPKLAEKCHFHDNGCKGGNIGSGNTADGYFSLRTLTPRYPTPKMGIPKIWYHKSANLTRAGLLKVETVEKREIPGTFMLHTLQRISVFEHNGMISAHSAAVGSFLFVLQ